MPPIDPDDELLRAIRAQRDEPMTDPGDAGEAGGPPGRGPWADPDDLDEVLLGRIGRAARMARADDEALIEPPAAVWQAVSRELGLDARAPVARLRLAPEPASSAAAPEPEQQRPGRRGSRWLAAAAAVTLVAGAAAAVVSLSGRGGGSSVVAEVALQPLEGAGEGSARLLRLADGQNRLAVDERFAAVPADSYVEVWLIDPASNLQRMVSLGVIRQDGTYDIPSGIDPATYRVVDVSIEPADGNPAHSGRSILRGTLPI